MRVSSPRCKHGTAKSSVNSQYLGSVLVTSFSFQMHKRIGQTHPGGTAELQGCRRSALVAVLHFAASRLGRSVPGEAGISLAFTPKTGQRSAPAAAAKHRSALAWVPGRAVLPPAAAPRAALPLLKLQPSQGFPCNSLCARREEFKKKKKHPLICSVYPHPLCASSSPKARCPPPLPPASRPGTPSGGERMPWR